MMWLAQVMVDDAPHPAMSMDGSWAGVMIILILGLVFAATAVGIAVRLNCEPVADETVSKQSLKLD